MEGCPSKQVSAAAITSASDKKWQPFNFFFLQSGRAKDLSAPLYNTLYILLTTEDCIFSTFHTRALNYSKQVTQRMHFDKNVFYCTLLLINMLSWYSRPSPECRFQLISITWLRVRLAGLQEAAGMASFETKSWHYDGET